MTFESILNLDTLDGVVGLKVSGVRPNNRLGFSVSGAGDLNNDGLSDVVVGAPNGSGFTTGNVYVLFGDRNRTSNLAVSSLDGSNGFRIDSSPGLLSLFGSAVSAAGDPNNDGIGDLILGNPTGTGFLSGQSHLVWGSNDDFLAVLDLTDSSFGKMLEVPTSSGSISQSGFSVSNAGDVNGDRIDDLIVGRLFASEPLNANDKAVSYVIFGGSNNFETNIDLSTLNGQNGFQIEEDNIGESVAYSVSGVGDVNGDGIADFIVASGNFGFEDKGTTVRSYVVFGRSGTFPASINLSSLASTEGFEIGGLESFQNSKVSVSAAGDVNADGLDDFVIGVPETTTSGNGKSYVVFGSRNFASGFSVANLDGRNGFSVNGLASGDALGYSVSGGGDLNGDGIDDLLIGAPFADPDGKNAAGEIYAIFGSRRVFSAEFDLANLDGRNGFRLSGVDAGDQAGFSVDITDDTNGDDIDDLVIGAPFSKNIPGSEEVTGEAYIIFGRQSEITTQLTNFLGAEIQLQRFYPNLDTTNGSAVTASVDDEIEFELASYDPDPSDTGFVGGYRFDLTSTSILYTAVDVPVDNPRHNDSDFNGFIFTDIAGQLPEILNIAIDPNRTTHNIDASDITFTEDTVAINLEGISYQPGETIKLDVSFAGLDLAVDSVSTSVTEAELGDRLTVDWTVSNQGTVTTATGWSDRLYLSTDNTLSPDDIPLGTLPAQKTQLAPGESYSQTLSVDLPVIDGFNDGTYQVLVKTDDADGQAETLETNNVGTTSLEVSTLPFALNGISTSRGSNQGQTTITLKGSQFKPDAAVRLIAPDGTVVVANAVQWQNSTELWATFDLQGQATGQYDVSVQQSGDGSMTLADRFEVTDGPVGNLDVEILATPTIRSDREGLVTVVYTNTGDTDLVAPLLQIDADNASLKLLDDDTFGEDPIQQLAINPDGPAGVLAPGATGRFVFNFDPLTAAGTDINFTVSTLTADTQINWDSIRDEARPSYLTGTAWTPVWDNFTDGVQGTTDTYVQTLAENATYLDSLGETVTGDVDRLIAFELQQASDYQALPQRYSLGSFGRGGSFVGDLRLVVDADSGDVSLQNGGLQRTFEQQADGSYAGVEGDDAVLVLNADGYRLTETDGTVTQFLQNGRLNYVEDTNDNRITATYSGDLLASLTTGTAEPQLTGTAILDTESLSFTYNAQGRITKATNQAGQEVTYGYDPTGELLTRVTTPAGTTQYSYDSRFNLTGITDANGTEAAFAYDDQGRLIQESLTSGTETVTYAYDSTGGVTITDAAGVQTQVLLNDRGQVAQLTDPLGRTLRMGYDADGNVTRMTAPDGSSTRLAYDAEGNLVSQVNPLGQQLSFSYEPNYDLLQSVTDARGNALSYGYDAQGNLTSITYADGSDETFSYDEQGNVMRSVNRREQAIDYTYNSRGQLLSQANPDGTSSGYAYDNRGNLLTATNGTGTIAMEYDTADRLTKITYPNGRSLAYEYDAGGRRTRMEDHDGNVVNYSYDAAGRLAGLTDGAGATIVSYAYDVVGRLAQETNGNGTYTTYSYDNAGQLLSIVNHAPGGGVNSREDYIYDALGQQVQAATLDGTWTYGYDATGQLVRAVFASTNAEIPNQDLTYVYDAAGNRVQTIVNGETTDYSTNNLNQYTSAGDAVYGYDDDGNLISKTEDGQTWAYSYDTENRLVGVVEPDGKTTQYEYDALGNRIATVYDGERTEYLVDPFGFGDVVGEYGNGGTSRYTHGIGLVSRSNAVDGTAFYDSNLIGSTTGLTGNSGDYLNRYSYRPFGQEISEKEEITNPFEFVGQWGVMEERNNLNFMRARFYEGDAGRFITPDPIGLIGNDPNFVRYAQNNPILGIDPIGLWTRSIGWTADGGAVGGGGIETNLVWDRNTPFWNPRVQRVISYGGYGGIGGSSGISFTYTNADDALQLRGRGADAGFSVDLVAAVDGTFVMGEGYEGGSISLGLGGGLGPVSVVGYATETFDDGILSNVARDFLVSRWNRAKTNLNQAWNNLENTVEQAYDDTIEFIDELGNDLIEFGEGIAETTTQVVSSIDGVIDAAIERFDAAINSTFLWGDPHLVTFDGVAYDFQGAGEFTLIKSIDYNSADTDGINIQARFLPWGDSDLVSVTTAVATIVDGKRVVIDSGGVEIIDGIARSTGNSSNLVNTVTIEGAPITVPLGGYLQVENSRIYNSGNSQYTIVYAGENGSLEDGDDQLVVKISRPGLIRRVDVYLGDEKKGDDSGSKVEGLLGDLDGNSADDIALDDGTPLTRNGGSIPYSELYGTYRDDWRVKNASESLFNYAPGQGPDTYYNENFPAAPITLSNLSPEQRALGEAAALAAGFTPGTVAFNSAALDFALTNDPGFLDSSDTQITVNESISVEDDRPDPTIQLPNFTGAELEIQIFNPNFQSPIINPLQVTVSDDVEVVSSNFPPQSNIVDHILDIRSDSIFYEAGPLAGSGFAGSGDFNGYVISDFADMMPDFKNVRINEATNSLGLEASDVTFTENTIYINFESIFYSPGKAFELDIDFAEITTGNSSIRGSVFDDRNTNNTQDTNEPGLAGVTVFLDENQNGQLDPSEQSKVTNNTGQYSFTNLPADTYSIRQIAPAGYVQTYPATQTTIGDGYADKVLEYFDSGTGGRPGPYGVINDNAPVDVTVDVVLGNNPSTALSLPTGSFVTVEFENEVIIDGPGNDIFITEDFPANERADVFVSSDLTTFVYLGEAGDGGVTSFDLATINFTQPVRAVKIVGLDDFGGSPGFDVASVKGLPDSIIAPDFHNVSLDAGESVNGLNFGNQFVTTGTFIQPDTAVASSENSNNHRATHTIDGSGLSDPLLGAKALHAPYRIGSTDSNHWTSEQNTEPRDQLIDWGFNTPQNLNQIHIWNHQSTVSPAANDGYDVTLFDLTLFDGADNILLTLNDVTLQPDTAAAQTFSFGQTISNVSRVRFEVEDIQSSPTYTGLAEVGFNAV